MNNPVVTTGLESHLSQRQSKHQPYKETSKKRPAAPWACWPVSHKPGHVIAVEVEQQQQEQ